MTFSISVSILCHDNPLNKFSNSRGGGGGVVDRKSAKHQKKNQRGTRNKKNSVWACRVVFFVLWVKLSFFALGLKSGHSSPTQQSFPNRVCEMQSRL